MGRRVDTYPGFGHFEGLTAAAASYLMLRCSVSSYLAVTAISEMPISYIPIYLRKELYTFPTGNSAYPNSHRTYVFDIDGVIGSDIALTATALVGFAEIVATAEESFNEKMELLVRRAYRPALHRVTIFRIRNVDSARIKRLRERLSIKIQDIGKSISEKTGNFDQKNYEPVIKASICNGEQVVGFKNKHPLKQNFHRKRSRLIRKMRHAGLLSVKWGRNNRYSRARKSSRPYDENGVE